MEISRLGNATGAITGLLFALVLVFAASVAGAPSANVSLTSTSIEVAQAFTEGTNNLITGSYVLLLSSFLLVVFTAYLRSVIGPTGNDEWTTTVGLGGGLLVAGVLTVVALIGVSQGQLTAYGPDQVIARTLLVLGWNGVWMTVPGFAALIGGMSATSLIHGTLPRGLGWSGALVTVILLTPLWGPGFMGALLWIAVVSVILVFREVRARDAVKDEAADD